MIVGFVGLGSMGSVLAGNLVATGHTLVTFDAAGPARAVEGASFAADVADIARQADVIVFSLPDGSASEAVAHEIAATTDRRVQHVIDTSTIGVTAARDIDALLGEAGLVYVDAPVSGGIAGARARTLSIMVAGPEAAAASIEPVLAGMTDRRYRVGDRPGMGQALKLANNFLSATALVATSEAIAFGESVGLDMATMLEVLNGSSGHNSATADKFPNHVLPKTFAAGFTNSLMSKDTQLYLRTVESLGAPSTVASVTASVWDRFVQDDPGVDFTRIYPYVHDVLRSGRVSTAWEEMND